MKRLLYLLILLPFSVLAAHTATITWTAPTTREDTTPIVGALTYNVYGGASGAETLVQSGVTTLTVTLSGFADGATVCWQITALEAGNTAGEGPRTNEVCRTFPSSPPSAPSGVTVTIT